MRQALGLMNGTTPFKSSMLRGSKSSTTDRNLAALGPWNIFPFPAVPVSMRGGAGNSGPLPPTPKKMKETQLGCAWSAAVTAATYNIAFPDLNCVYQVLLYWGVTGKTTLRIDGLFPHVRYFSFQSYDLQSGTPIASLIDYEIKALKGINPFNTEPLRRGKWDASRASGRQGQLGEGWDNDNYEVARPYDKAGYKRVRDRNYAQAERGRDRRGGKYSDDDTKDSSSSWETASNDEDTSTIEASSSKTTSSSYGSYQIHVTDDGNHGFPNELAASSSSAGRSFHRQCGAKGCVALVIMRLYTAEPGEDAFHHNNQEDYNRTNATSRLWGYVPRPEVSVRYGAWVNEWTGNTMERYKILESCHDDKSTVVKSFLDWKIPQIQGDWSGQSALDNLDDNFVVYTPSSSSRALFANADASYLFATARNNRSVSAINQGSGPQRKELVARITGRLPTVAHGFMEPQTLYDDKSDEGFHDIDKNRKLQPHRIIADLESYEARYVSLSTIALKGAGPVIDTIMDVVMEQKYQGQEGWDLDRQFSVVAAPGARLLDRCPPRIYRSDRDLFLKTVQPEEREPPAHLAFLYRQILSQWQTRGRLDKSIARAKHDCLGRNDGGHACKLRSFFVDRMGQQYPSIKYFYCWENVTRGCSCEDSTGKVVGWGNENDADDVDDDLWSFPHHHHHNHNHNQYLFDDNGEKLEHNHLDFMQGNSEKKANNISSGGLVTEIGNKTVVPWDPVIPTALITPVASLEHMNESIAPMQPVASVKSVTAAVPKMLAVPMKTETPLSPMMDTPVDPVINESVSVFVIPDPSMALNVSNLSGGVHPDAWNQSQAYYYYMQHQKDSNPQAIFDDDRKESTLLVAQNKNQKESKLLVAADDLIREQQHGEQKQLQEHHEQGQEMQHGLEEQQYHVKEPLQVNEKKSNEGNKI